MSTLHSKPRLLKSILHRTDHFLGQNVNSQISRQIFLTKELACKPHNHKRCRTYLTWALSVAGEPGQGLFVHFHHKSKLALKPTYKLKKKLPFAAWLHRNVKSHELVAKVTKQRLQPEWSQWGVPLTVDG